MDNPKSFEIKNRFIVVEGIDGSGKTSLATGLYQIIQELTGESSYLVHQPGTTKIGTQVKTIFKDKSLQVRARTRQLLMEAARVDLLLFIENQRWITPNAWFVCDRHQDSTWAYQRTEGVPLHQIHYSQLSYDDLIKPDLTIYLDVDPAIAMARISKDRSGNNDTYDTKDVEFFKVCKENYEKRIFLDRDHYLVVDANKSKQEVYEFVRNNLRFH